MASGTMGLSEGFAPHLRDVMDILHDVWNAIKPEQIRRCWRKSTLIDYNQPPANIDNNIVATSDTAAETVTTDQHDSNVEDVLAEVFVFVESHDCKPIGDNELDEIIWELALAVQTCKISTQAKNDLIEGWVSMEDNQQCNGILVEEIVQLMDLEVLCQLKEMSIEGNDEDSEDEDFLEEDKPTKPVTFDEVNALAVQLKSLQVQISQLGGEYHAVALGVGTDYDNLLSIYRKNENRELSRKLKAAHQTLITAFINK
jgi:hypothetical protein